MNRYNAQILNDKGEYHLQFETDSKDNFKAVEKVARKCMDRKPPTNFSKITESAEILAEIMDNYRWCPYFSNSTCESEIECKECIIEWLQKEIDDEEDK